MRRSGTRTTRSFLEQLSTDVDQQVGKQGLLRREMPIDGGSTDTGLRCQVLHRHRSKPPLGEESRGRANELLAPFGFHTAAVRHLFHSSISPGRTDDALV